jgi:hypothetical protein
MHFMVTGSTKEGAITNVYGPQSPQDKESFLKRIDHIKTLLNMPNWVLGGDFNMILMLEEKTGGTKRLEQDSGKFKSLIDQLNLVDIETRNGIFTWSNRRSGHQQVACRLDRFLGSGSPARGGSCHGRKYPTKNRLGSLAHFFLSGHRGHSQTQTLPF